VPWPRLASFALALVVLFVAVASPLDTIGEHRLFSVHMLQHVLIGDVAPLLVVLGLTGPLLRPALALPVVPRLRWLAFPLVALPLWAIDLGVWHLPPLYDAALRHPAVHDLEHALFFACGLLLWMALLEPLPGPRWFGTGARLASLGFVWIVGGALAQVFLWDGRLLYPPYRTVPRLWGLSPIADQRVGGGVMLLEMSLVVLAVATMLGLRWLQESELRQRLVESGVPPERAARAVRYGKSRA
jgi:putative membrane protein